VIVRRRRPPSHTPTTPPRPAIRASESLGSCYDVLESATPGRTYVVAHANWRTPLTSPHPTARSRLAISLGVAGALALAAAAHGCAEGAEERLPPPDALATSTAAPCADGAKRTCYVTLGEAAGTVSCLVGSQVCLGGTWGECEGDRTFELSRDELGPLPPGSGLSSMALSSPAGLPFNVCNPFCLHFDEVPDGGLTARLDASPEDPGAVNTGPTVPYDWVGGTYTVLSPQTTASCSRSPAPPEPTASSTRTAATRRAAPATTTCARSATRSARPAATAWPRSAPSTPTAAPCRQAPASMIPA
jgi:hypothetical protein